MFHNPEFAGAVFYGDSGRSRMVTDADDLWRRLPKDSMWGWAFLAVARVNSRPWEQTGRGVASGWKEIVKLQGTDCEAGTVAAALWMGRAMVRLACTHGLLALRDVPGDVQVDCEVKAEDVEAARQAREAPLDPPAPKPAPKPKPAADKATKKGPRASSRKRNAAKVVNVDQFGGPVQKMLRGKGTGSTADSATADDAPRDSGSDGDGGTKATKGGAGKAGAAAADTQDAPSPGAASDGVPIGKRCNLHTTVLQSVTCQPHAFHKCRPTSTMCLHVLRCCGDAGWGCMNGASAP